MQTVQGHLMNYEENQAEDDSRSYFPEAAANFLSVSSAARRRISKNSSPYFVSGQPAELRASWESANIARVAPVYGHRRSALAGVYWRLPYRTDGDRRRNCARTLV